MEIIYNLKVNNTKIDLGIDTQFPTFSWLVKVRENQKGIFQKAYRVVVSSSKDKAEKFTGDVWDSGKMLCENNYDIVYKGSALKSKTRYYWSVQVWLGRDKDSEDIMQDTSVQSGAAEFETGIMDQGEWTAKWIGVQGKDLEDRYAPVFRKEFTVDDNKDLLSARVYICGLGLYDLKINGQNPDDTVLNPAHSQYEKTVLYNVFDVTRLCRERKNIESENAKQHVITVELGNGFYNETIPVWKWEKAVWRDNPKLIMELALNYTDGTTENIITDETWKVTEGPVISNSIYFGDVYDSRLEKDGCCKVGYNDENWNYAGVVPKPEGQLKFQNMEPIRKTDIFRPEIRKYKDGTYMILNPVMTTGWAKITAKAKRSGVMDITYGERLTDEGLLVKPDAWDNKVQVDKYTFRSGEPESFEPRFSYKGYRYIQVDFTNCGEDPEIVEAICYGIHNDVECISSFESSDDMINKLHEIEVRTILNNFHGKPTDTPVWEKNGWTGDVNVALDTIFYNLDISAFMSKFMNDMDNAQLSNGVVPIIAPSAEWGVINSPVWNSVYIFMAEYLYNSFGMDSIAEKYYESMARLVRITISDIERFGWVWEDEYLGDWVCPRGAALKGGFASPPEGAAITNTAFIYKMLETMAEIAVRLRRNKDCIYYKDVMKKIYNRFNEVFYKPDEGIYETGYWKDEIGRTKYRQTDQLTAIAFGLVPEEYVKNVLENLIEDIKKKDYHLDTGIVGTKFILPVLSENGYEDIAYKILTQTTYPSWGFWVENGSTTTWEGYEIACRSRNHFFLGTYDEWLFKGLAGIRDMKDGYRTFKIKPVIVKDLKYVKASVMTPRGLLESSWEIKEDGTVNINVNVPFGATAEVHFSKTKKIIKSGSQMLTFSGIMLK